MQKYWLYLFLPYYLGISFGILYISKNAHFSSKGRRNLKSTCRVSLFSSSLAGRCPARVSQTVLSSVPKCSLLKSWLTSWYFFSCFLKPSTFCICSCVFRHKSDQNKGVRIVGMKRKSAGGGLRLGLDPFFRDQCVKLKVGNDYCWLFSVT